VICYDVSVHPDGHCEVVRLLLEAGADANVHDSLLVTPLHLAALGQFSAHLLLTCSMLIVISQFFDMNFCH